MNLGIVGTGAIVSEAVAAAQRVNGIALQAVYSRKQETGERIASEFGISTVYTSFENFLSDTKIDTVYLASPNGLHGVQAKAALEHGKHVIVEKPFTSTKREAKTLRAIAQKNKLFLFEAISTRYLPNYAYIKRQLPKLGQLRMVQCSFSQFSSRYDAFLRGERPNVFCPEFSGGAWMDLNLYNIQFVMGLFGEPLSGEYFANCHPNGIDTSGAAVLRYPGFLCVCEGAKDTEGPNSIQVQGEKGYLLVNGKANACPDVELVLRDGTRERFNRQEESRLYYEFEFFEDCIHHGNYEACWEQLDLTIQVVEWMERLRKEAGIRFAADE